MWLLLPNGALSITRNVKEPDKLQVRARRAEWLDAFRAYCPELGPNIHTPDHDYQWRALATPEQVGDAVRRFTLSIDYDNFKSTAGSPRRGLKNRKLRADLVHAYHSIWSVLLSAGDGTSAYNKPVKAAKPVKAPQGDADAGTIDICVRLGHWWSSISKKCVDCDKRGASARALGSRPTPEEVEAWWAARPEKKRPVAAATS